MLKIPSLKKDAYSENYALAGKKGICNTLSKSHCAKAIEMHNHPDAIPGHAAREMDACRVLGKPSIR